MISLRPDQYRGFTRRLRFYAFLLALLQLVGFLALTDFGMGNTGLNGPIFLLGFRVELARLWVLSAIVLLIVFVLFLKYGIRIRCPHCLGTLGTVTRHRLYYCPRCDQYTDDGTMERLATAPQEPANPGMD
jgi:hypothetical protein